MMHSKLGWIKLMKLIQKKNDFNHFISTYSMVPNVNPSYDSLSKIPSFPGIRQLIRSPNNHCVKPYTPSVPDKYKILWGTGFNAKLVKREEEKR